MGGWGGRRDGAGRKPGVPNKNGTEIRELASQYGPAVIKRLAEMSGIIPGALADSPAVQVAAMKELLDRGFGRATQLIAGDEERGPVHYIFEWADALPVPVVAEAVIDDDTHADTAPLVLEWETC